MKLSYLWHGLPGHPIHPPLTDAAIGSYTFATAAATAQVLGITSHAGAYGWWIAAALARDIDVMCQKPLAPSLDEALGLARLVTPRARLMVHENWRFRPWYRELKRWLEAGDLGPILSATLSERQT